MEVREAVAEAKKYVQELFAQESISNLGLEEVEFDEAAGAWSITVGFSRPWETPQNALAVLARQLQPPRAYKIVRIHDKTRQLISVKNREPTHAA
jgi:hypothetical protein